MKCSANKIFKNLQNLEKFTENQIKAVISNQLNHYRRPVKIMTGPSVVKNYCGHSAKTSKILNRLGPSHLLLSPNDPFEGRQCKSI